jgi:hypothetical protein
VPGTVNTIDQTRLLRSSVKPFHPAALVDKAKAILS